MWTSARADDRVFEILKTVAHPLRMRILALLCQRDETVGAIAERLGAKPTAISQALSILRRERLVAVTRGHGFARYRLEERALRVLIPCIERTLLSPSRPTRGPTEVSAPEPRRVGLPRGAELDANRGAPPQVRPNPGRHPWLEPNV